MAKDPYRFFRIEARELAEALMRGALALPGGVDADAVRTMLRQAHTLKGAARVVSLPAIADGAHAIEDMLAPLRAAGGGSSELSVRMLAGVDAIRADLDRLDAPPEPTPTAARASPPAPAPAPVSRVEVAELDALLRELRGMLPRLRQADDALSAVADAAKGLERHVRGGPDGLLREIQLAERRGRAALASARSALDGAQARAEVLRLPAAGSLLPRLERVVHDACAQRGVAARVSLEGGEVRIEPELLATIDEALQHLLRNAIAHGIEPEADRERSGKAPAGAILVRFVRRPGAVEVSCRDDGRGMDAAAIRAAAVAAGRLTPERASALPDADAYRLALLPGVSTAAGVDTLAGRGIGLDVAAVAASGTGGDVRIASERGRGTAITLTLPSRLSAEPVIAVEGGGQLAYIPRAQVQATRCLGEGERIAAQGLPWEDRLVPCAPLAALLGTDTGASPRALLMVRDGDGAVALLVDRILGTRPAVLMPLPPGVRRDGIAAGIAETGDGRPAVVLDAAALASAVRAQRWSPPDAARRDPTPVLVIDDSLTTRMLERSILESAGYLVELASSAEEGLVKVRAGRYALCVVDVEMPGMDGFGFVATLRGDPVLHAMPAILVTSLSSDEHRRRGADAGAQAYLVKGEFDQARFLATVKRLAG